MARIARVGDDVAVQLGVWEKIAGLHHEGVVFCLVRYIEANKLWAVNAFDHDPVAET